MGSKQDRPGFPSQSLQVGTESRAPGAVHKGKGVRVVKASLRMTLSGPYPGLP